MERRPLSWIALAPLLLLVLLIGIAPFASAVFNAFFHDVYGERSFAGLDNFRRFFAADDFGYSLRISLLWALLNTALSLAAGFWFGLLLARRGRLSRLLYAVLLIPWGVPIYIAVPLWRVLLHGSGGESVLTALFGIRLNLLIDPAAGFLAALTVSVWAMAPLTAFVLAGAMQRLPRSASEAARMEGASEVQIAAALTLPQIKGTVLVMAVLNFLKSFKEFTVIFLMTAGGPPMLSGITERSIVGATETLEIFLYELFQSTDDFGIPAAFAAVVAGVVLLIMAFWFFARQTGSPGVDRGRRSRLLALTAAVQPLFGGLLGLPWAAGYLLCLRWRKLLVWVAGAQFLAAVIRLAVQGYPAGIDPGLAVALLALLLLRRRRDRPLLPGRTAGAAWRLGSGGSAIVMTVGSVAIVYLVLWLSASRISSAYVDALLPRFFSLESYPKIVAEEGIFRFFANSALLAVCTAALVPLVSFPAAAFLARRGLRVSFGLLTLVQITAIAGGMHALIPLYAIFRGMGLIGSYVPLVLIYAAHALPFALFTTTAFLEKLPASLWENALAEGMSRSAFLLRIQAPLALPVIGTSMIVAFLGAWNGFLAPLLFLTDDARYTVSVKLYSLVGTIAGGSPKWNLFAAASVINLGLLFAVLLRFRRPLQSSILTHYED